MTPADVAPSFCMFCERCEQSSACLQLYIHQLFLAIKDPDGQLEHAHAQSCLRIFNETCRDGGPSTMLASRWHLGLRSRHLTCVCTGQMEKCCWLCARHPSSNASNLSLSFPPFFFQNLFSSCKNLGTKHRGSGSPLSWAISEVSAESWLSPHGFALVAALV